MHACRGEVSDVVVIAAQGGTRAPNSACPQIEYPAGQHSRAAIQIELAY